MTVHVAMFTRALLMYARWSCGVSVVAMPVAKEKEFTIRLLQRELFVMFLDGPLTLLCSFGA